MDFEIKNLKQSVVTVARALGYVIIDAKENGEYNLVRRLAGQNYPRFHIYLRQAGDNFNFNLHLDQKKPSYEGSHAHSGEYAGPIVEEEATRVRDALSNL